MRRDPLTGTIQGAEPVRIDRGRPRACLLLHGWITSPADFADLPAALDAAGWDVHAPLHAGHGTSPDELKGITADRLLERARQNYRDLRASHEHVALVGFSMGGTIATILAAEEPPQELVLVSPYFAVRYRWFYVLPPRWWSKLVSPFVHTVKRPERMVFCNRPEGREAIITYDSFPTEASEALFDLRRIALKQAGLASLCMPVLLVYSTGDHVCSPVEMVSVFNKLPSEAKRKATFVRSNHHILHDHDREEAVAAITSFLAQP